MILPLLSHFNGDADVSEEEYLFELPKSLSQEGVNRYNFHGLWYQYVMEALQSCTAGSTRTAYPMYLALRPIHRAGCTHST